MLASGAVSSSAGKSNDLWLLKNFEKHDIFIGRLVFHCCKKKIHFEDPRPFNHFSFVIFSNYISLFSMNSKWMLLHLTKHVFFRFENDTLQPTDELKLVETIAERASMKSRFDQREEKKNKTKFHRTKLNYVYYRQYDHRQPASFVFQYQLNFIIGCAIFLCLHHSTWSCNMLFSKNKKLIN